MKRLLIILILFSPLIVSSQIINGYAQVSSIAGNVAYLTNVDESGDSFEEGENLIIIQMQDNVIGANTSDNSSFGNLSSIGSAGLYEIIPIISVSESEGTPISINFERIPNNTYNFSENSVVQVVTFPKFGNPNYTTTQNLTAKSWDGNTGGVLTFEVEGTLTLGHSLSASQQGFRGANANAGSSTGCTGSSFFRTTSHEYYANKGEGIYKVTSASYAAGRAKIINGGGGGNSHNAGGGGGGNASEGGLGGPGWPTCSPTAGGMGGVSLDAHISSNRVFMGGGGGSGEGNNGGTKNAGDGGGIILIKANEVKTSGSSELTISSNGESITTSSSNDGNSGGGAGGSLVFEVNTWSISALAPLKIECNGGDGGPAITENEHGGGGGGGLGSIIFSSAKPTQNVTIENIPGNGGLNCTTCATAENGWGSSNEGIIESTPGPLPVELLKFDAIPNPKEKIVNLLWITASETNNDYFTIEKTKDLELFEVVTTVTGQGTTTEQTKYEEVDFTPYEGTSFYKLSQTDFRGKTTAFNLEKVSMKFDNFCEVDLELYPNPNSGDLLFIKVPNLASDQVQVLVNDFLGKQFMVDFSMYNHGDYSLITIELNKKLVPGTYLVNVAFEDRVISQGFIVK